GPVQERELVKTKSMYFNDTLSSGAIDNIVRLVEIMPIGAIAELSAYGGILATQPGNLTAFVHRTGIAYHLLITVPLTGNSTADTPIWAWIKQWDTMVRPFSNHQSYQGFLDSDLQDPEKSYFGDNFQKLQDIKAKYDPKNVFSSGQPNFGADSSPLTNQNSPDTFVPGTCPWVSGGNPPGPRSSGIGKNDNRWMMLTRVLGFVVIML
ncbi:17136_t:CDS:2, partial [Acaulospora morrowiae]